MKEAPGPSVSEEIADIFRNYDIDTYVIICIFIFCMSYMLYTKQILLKIVPPNESMPLSILLLNLSCTIMNGIDVDGISYHSTRTQKSCHGCYQNITL